MEGEEKTTTAGGENQDNVQNQEDTTVTQNGTVSEQPADTTKEEAGGDAPADTQTSEGTE